MLDTYAYNKKPSKKSAGNISNRIIKNSVALTPQELAEEIIKGKSFMPCLLKENANRRTKSNWKQQQLICLDIDSGLTLKSALSKFKHDAIFIYTTFSHTEENNKFRVVFQLDKPITDNKKLTNIINSLLKKYPEADQRCKDITRLFFGGKDLYVLDYNNKLNTNSLLTLYNTTNINSNRHQSSISSNNITSNSISSTNNVRTNICSTNKSLSIYLYSSDCATFNIESVQKLDVLRLQEILNIVKYPHVEVKNNFEFYSYLHTRNLADFLGITKRMFNCIFHEDESPSANIVWDKITDNYYYKCFGCDFVGNIIRCVERIASIERIDAIDFLSKVYKVKLVETDWQKRQKRMLEENQRYIMSEEFKLEHPELYEEIKNYLTELYTLNGIAKDYIKRSPDDINIFFASLRYLSEVLGVSLGTVKNRVNLFAYLGLIKKLKEDELNEALRKRSIQEKTRNKVPFAISFYSIPSYSDKILTEGGERAINSSEKKLNIKKISYKMLKDILGKKEADRVFPQLANRPKSINKKFNDLSDIN